MRDLEIRGAGNIFGPEQSGQVAAVGYDMYVKMIAEAVREARGDYSSLRDSELETRVDWPVDAYLPESYVRGETQRIEVYKRVAMVRSQAEEEELIADLMMVQILPFPAQSGADRTAARWPTGWWTWWQDGFVCCCSRYAADPQTLYQALRAQGATRASTPASGSP